MADHIASRDKKLVLWYKEVNNNDVGLVGGKNASLGEMYQELTKKGTSSVVMTQHLNNI
jgi:pyruvate,water dikinase